MISTFFKGMKPYHITQGFHAGHPALDIVSTYGTPLCAPEDCLVLGITGDTYTPDSTANLKRGYGIRLRGKETGYEYLYWHCLPYFPVWGGDSVKRGQIVAYMGNAGYVLTGGKEVPLDERLSPTKPGTHLHIELFEGSGRNDPAPLINYNWQPTYTYLDYVKSMMVVLQKMARNIR